MALFWRYLSENELHIVNTNIHLGSGEWEERDDPELISIEERLNITHPKLTGALGQPPPPCPVMLSVGALIAARFTSLFPNAESDSALRQALGWLHDGEKLVLLMSS